MITDRHAQSDVYADQQTAQKKKEAEIIAKAEKEGKPNPFGGPRSKTSTDIQSDRALKGLGRL